MTPDNRPCPYRVWRLVTALAFLAVLIGAPVLFAAPEPFTPQADHDICTKKGC